MLTRTLVWESVEHHKAAVAQGLIDPILKDHAILGEIKYLFDVEAKEDVRAALNAPVTEFAFLTIKEGVSPADVEEKVTRLSTLAKGWGRAKGNYGGSWGSVANDRSRIFIMLGWESFEVMFHLERTQRHN